MRADRVLVGLGRHLTTRTMAIAPAGMDPEHGDALATVLEEDGAPVEGLVCVPLPRAVGAAWERVLATVPHGAVERTVFSCGTVHRWDLRRGAWVPEAEVAATAPAPAEHRQVSEAEALVDKALGAALPPGTPSYCTSIRSARFTKTGADWTVGADLVLWDGGEATVEVWEWLRLGGVCVPLGEGGRR
ncbi:hypothetical protein JYK14_24545 [Siccirubricoccus sp. KC 17139]|uniref:Uncharacterized protein n=1 Tax=Siccirubricoccus soli TaxID=2899147 RepID=A0ABT1DDK9_9PROT|nr:hypothetical protein [Siccirubricoccus soli]MCO6419305.1 hypothetical protein [Siccirubricoccus soli]MCP2685440.1 hypothetical protein [Siccirubricoccus soli]